MKRIIVIFMIIFCLLSFTGISLAEKEISTFGELWNSLDRMHKIGYVRGFRDGIIVCFNELILLTSPYEPDDEEIRRTLLEMLVLYEFIWEYGEAIINVMDDLYKDPANVYIHWPSMCRVACQKLKGEDIEQLLREVRKAGYLKPLINIQEYKEKK